MRVDASVVGGNAGVGSPAEPGFGGPPKSIREVGRASMLAAQTAPRSARAVPGGSARHAGELAQPMPRPQRDAHAAQVRTAVGTVEVRAAGLEQSETLGQRAVA